MTAVILIALALLLLVYSLFNYIVSLRWDEAELRQLETAELHLSHVLRLLDAPDVRMLLADPDAREDVLREFSSCLKDDVLKLIRTGSLGIRSLLFAGLFFSSYYLIRLKAKAFCSHNDLRFLSAVEMTFIRTLRSPT